MIKETTKNYNKKQQTMKNEIIFNEWIIFINKYVKYFLSHEELWDTNLQLVKEYIIKYNKKPSITNTYKNIVQLGQWILTQKHNYKTK